VHGQSRKYQQGILVDTGEYDWCHHDCAPFDRPTWFFCVQLSDGVVVGSRDSDWIWAYDSSKMFAFQGRAVSVRYGKNSIWIVRPDGKEIHLSRDHLQDVFMSEKCTAAVHRNWLQQIGHITRPVGVPTSAVFVPEGPPSLFRPQAPHFWVTCSIKTNAKWDVCDLWDEKGSKYKEMQCVGPNGEPLPGSVLTIDPLTTKFDYEIHLINGQVLHDIG
jgi:hypothetical protein